MCSVVFRCNLEVRGGLMSVSFPVHMGWLAVLTEGLREGTGKIERLPFVCRHNRRRWGIGWERHFRVREKRAPRFSSVFSSGLWVCDERWSRQPSCRVLSEHRWVEEVKFKSHTKPKLYNYTVFLMCVCVRENEKRQWDTDHFCNLTITFIHFCSFHAVGMPSHCSLIKVCFYIF